MSLEWHTGPLLGQFSVAGQLASLDGCFSMEGRRVVSDPKSLVTFHDAGDVRFYVKRYVRSGKYLRKYLGRSRVRAEWENLLLFQQWGIATPPMLAWGEERSGVRYRRGALVTIEVPHAVDLKKLSIRHAAYFFQRAHFREMARQVADYTRRMHEHGFAHGDLNWRNILVSYNPATPDLPARVVFFDCPAGRFWWGPFLQRRILKDLAHLDKMARTCLPLRWRLWFFKQYTGRSRLTPADRQLLHKIHHYFD